MQNNKANAQKAWKQTYLVDRKQIDSAARDIPKLFPNALATAPQADKFAKLLAQAEQNELKITKEERTTFTKLSQIATDISSLRETLRNFDQTNEFLVKVQGSSQNILGKLEQFRGKMAVSYEDLAEQEETLEEELQAMARKIEHMGEREEAQEVKEKENVKTGNREIRPDWRRQEKSPECSKQQPTTKLQIIEQRMKEKEREVQTTQKEISGLGKNLGWSEEDHTDFLAIWQRQGGRNYFQIEEELQSYFTFYTGEQIQEHMNKYIRWKKLTEEKKQLIVTYKTLKEEKKIEELRVMELERDQSNEKRERAEARRRQQKEQEELKGKVSQWKEAKAREKREQEERKRQQEVERKREEALRRRQAVERQKQVVGQWKQQEQQKKQTLKRVQSARKPVAVDKQTEQRIRRRQEQIIQKKIELVQEKKRQEEMQRQKEQRIKDNKFVKFSHVTNKLQHKTTAIREKQREKFDGKDRKQANTFGGQLLMTGVRATPNWLKGL